MNLRYFALVLVLALFVPAFSQAAGRVWTVQYSPSFHASLPSNQNRAPTSFAQSRTPSFSIRSEPLNLRGQNWSIRNAVAPTIQNSMQTQIASFTPSTRSQRSNRVSARRSRVGRSGHGVNSSGYEFPLR